MFIINAKKATDIHPLNKLHKKSCPIPDSFYIYRVKYITPSFRHYC